MSARKDDAGKPPISLIPRSAIWAEARVMAKGAKKYGAHNWRKGMSWSRVLDAALRHITDYADGHDVDDGPDGSGESNLANARCCLAFLIEYAEKGLGEDDRPLSSKPSEAKLGSISSLGLGLVKYVGAQPPTSQTRFWKIAWTEKGLGPKGAEPCGSIGTRFCDKETALEEMQKRYPNFFTWGWIEGVPCDA